MFKDALTNWVEVFAIPNKKAHTIAEVFVDEIYCRYGAPKVLISDKGTEFANELVGEILKIVKVHQITTTPYNPRSDGLVENHMGTLKNYIRTYINKAQDNWDEQISFFAHAYRTTVGAATGLTPYFLMFGREASIPSDDYLDRAINGMPLTEYASNVAKMLRECWQELAELKPSADEHRNRVRQPRVFKPFVVDQEVYLTRTPKRLYKGMEGLTSEQVRKITAKIQPRFSGPYRVVKVRSPVLYEVSVDGRIKVCHALRMKPA